MSKFAKPVEPAEPDPGPGWLRSRFLGASLPAPRRCAVWTPKLPGARRGTGRVRCSRRRRENDAMTVVYQ